MAPALGSGSLGSQAQIDVGSSLSGWAGIVGLALTVVALVLACYQTWAAHRQTIQLEAHSDALSFVTGSLSTRFLGAFPNYLTSVIELIDSAESDLHIVTGNPIPAYFTAPSLFLAYSQAIERRVRSGLSVSLICMGKKQRRRRLELQFPTEEDAWQEWLTLHRSSVDDFLRFRFSELEAAKLDCDQFLDLLERVQEDLVRETFRFRGVSVTEVDTLVSLQVWIADSARAVFAIQTSSKDAMSYGLVTSDPLFVNALTAMIKLYEV